MESSRLSTQSFSTRLAFTSTVRSTPLLQLSLSVSPSSLRSGAGPGDGGLRTPVSQEFVVFVARAGLLIRATPKAVCSL